MIPAAQLLRTRDAKHVSLSLPRPNIHIHLTSSEANRSSHAPNAWATGHGANGTRLVGVDVDWFFFRERAYQLVDAERLSGQPLHPARGQGALDYVDNGTRAVKLGDARQRLDLPHTGAAAERVNRARFDPSRGVLGFRCGAWGAVRGRREWARLRGAAARRGEVRCELASSKLGSSTPILFRAAIHSIWRAW